MTHVTHVVLGRERLIINKRGQLPHADESDALVVEVKIWLSA